MKCLPRAKRDRPIRLLIVPCLLFAVARAAPAATYFVAAAGGSDENPGTREAPLRTISRAAALLQPGDTCLVRAGVYRETVRPARSGRRDAPIRFAAYRDEPVLISGADPLTGWQPWRDRIHHTAAEWDFDQLFVDGTMMIQARWPNTGPDLLHPKLAEADQGIENRVLVDADLTQPDGFWEDATLHLTPGSHWISWTRTVDSYSREERQLRFEAYADPKGGAYVLKRGSRYYLTGKLGALDSPGEWHLDRPARRVYLWTPAGDDPTRHAVEAKRRRLAFDLSGRSHVQLGGFRVFAAAVDLSDSQHCLVEDCHFRYVSHFVECFGWGTGMDNTGIVVSGSHNEIRDSSVAISAGNGIALLGENNRVVNCLVHDVDYAAVDCGAIRARGTGHLIAHNTLYNTGRSVLVHRNLKRARIEYNHMYNAGLLTSDLGVTYCFQTDGQGTVIAYNRVHDNHAHTGVGIYIDNFSPNHVLHHNISYNNKDSGIRLNTPTANVSVYNNTLYHNGNSIGWWGRNNSQQPGVVVANNITTDSVSLGTGARAHHNSGDMDPGFVDAERADFRLKPDSPCIDAGAVIPGITDGYAGRAPDLGAREHGTDPWTAGHDWGKPPRVWLPENH